ncbi:hypothetical protein N9992_00245 [bacterium]|jgi:hypothetical protein|nr:hypothetical protein [bacterium]|tara:strand:+ start:44 stop:268 length:225 start_codon:yes stop_codon:yes gene_type:complete
MGKANSMGKILQFPSKVELDKGSRMITLNETLDEVEVQLGMAMQELDILNEEIVTLTENYNRILKELKDLVLQE